MHTTFQFNFSKRVSRRKRSTAKNPGGEINPFTYASWEQKKKKSLELLVRNNCLLYQLNGIQKSEIKILKILYINAREENYQTDFKTTHLMTDIYHIYINIYLNNTLIVECNINWGFLLVIVLFLYLDTIIYSLKFPLRNNHLYNSNHKKKDWLMMDVF